MKESGIALSGIPHKEFMNIKTDKGESVVKALERSDIPYYARLSDSAVMIAFSSPDKKKIEDIVNKITAENVMSEALERYRSDPEDLSNVKALLPEIAEVLNVSVSSLERKPPDMQIQLAAAYTNAYPADAQTLKNVLKGELPLVKEPPEMPQEAEKTQPEKQQINNDNAEKIQRHEMAEKHEKGGPYMSINIIKAEAKRIREERYSKRNAVQITEKTEEIERTRM